MPGIYCEPGNEELKRNVENRTLWSKDLNLLKDGTFKEENLVRNLAQKSPFCVKLKLLTLGQSSKTPQLYLSADFSIDVRRSVAGKVWRRTGHASQTQWSIHLRAQRPMSGRWAPRLSPIGARPLYLTRGVTLVGKVGIPNFLTLGAVYVGRSWCLTTTCPNAV